MQNAFEKNKAYQSVDLQRFVESGVLSELLAGHLEKSTLRQQLQRGRHVAAVGHLPEDTMWLFTDTKQSGQKQ